MHLALATQDALPDWEVDDLPLLEALADRGATVSRPAWRDRSIDWSRFDGVLIRTTWDYHEDLDAFLAWVARVSALTRLFNPAPVIAWNTHKSYLHDLHRLGAPVTPTAWLARGVPVDVEALCAEWKWSRGFLKPMVGSTAWETLRFTADPDGLRAAQAHVDRLLPDEDLMLQPYLDAVEASGELSLIVIDGVPTHGVRKVPMPGDYRVQEEFGARDEPYGFAAGEQALALRIVGLAEQHLGIAPGGLLYARVDFLRDVDGRLNLNELELVEPSMFFRHAPAAAERLAAALIARAAT
jgi:hypothetical protein